MTTKTIRIRRRNWLRGELDGFLWHPNRQQGCCLGHAMKQVCAIKWDRLADKDMPCATAAEVKATFYEKVGTNSHRTMQGIARVNDDDLISDEVRERKLEILFEDKLGLKLEFYD